MTKIIKIEELKKKMDGNEDFYLIDALAPASFELQHIPGAKNIPNGPEFLKKFEEEVTTSKDAEIIVYCASSTCMSSVQAANTLVEAGYTNVSDFEDGLAGWKNAGYAFESEN